MVAAGSRRAGQASAQQRLALDEVAIITLPMLLGGWRQRVHRHLARVPELARILMKPRNGEAWTLEDRAFLRRELRTLARWAPALVVFLLPGGSALLPLYAWLLDRRRTPRQPEARPSVARPGGESGAG